jgi:hypothetical protein
MDKNSIKARASLGTLFFLRNFYFFILGKIEILWKNEILKLVLIVWIRGILMLTEF